MARIAFILLCHKDPESIIQQANQLTGSGDFMAIHFDKSAKKEHYQALRDALDDNPNVVFAKKRVKCGWGEWSLVQATIHALTAAVDEFPKATHFYMLSGDCMAIKSASYSHRFLDNNEKDFIESFDFFESDWIKTGMKEDRLVLRHFFNERNHKNLFYWSAQVQRKLGLQRKIPNDIQMMIGSQWWCLRRRTAEWVLNFCKERKDVMTFFRTTWIPDETFFQTIVRHLVPEREIETRTLTFLMFSDYGMPVTFFNDHYEMLLSQDFLFARKVSPQANELKARLGDLYNSRQSEFSISNEGRRLHKFLTERGRIGRRFAPRFWETEATLGRERELMIITCKKWHVAKRLLWQIKRVTGVPVIEYLFDEESTPMPNLGGIQTTLDKRARHRRALLRMLFDFHQTDRMVICLDPKNLFMLQDFYADRCTTRLLELNCNFTDDYLIGHATRVGLASETTPKETIQRLLPTVRYDVAFESDQIRDANFTNLFRVSEELDSEENVVPLANFLEIPSHQAQDILSLDHLFAD